MVGDWKGQGAPLGMRVLARCSIWVHVIGRVKVLRMKRRPRVQVTKRKPDTGVESAREKTKVQESAPAGYGADKYCTVRVKR